MDSEPVQTEAEQDALIRRHYQKMFDHPIFAQSKFVFAFENNYGGRVTASHLDTLVSDLPVHVYWEKDHPGVNKTGKVTRAYQLILTTTLAHNSLLFDSNLFTVTRTKDVQSMLNLAEEQMRRMHWEKKRANDNFGEDRFALTGKIGSKSDDLLITICMLLYVNPFLFMIMY